MSTLIDKQSFDEILSTPWLKSSIIETGKTWGTEYADVKCSTLPKYLVGSLFYVDSRILRTVLYRCDHSPHRGWIEEISITITDPNGIIHTFGVPPSTELKDGHSHVITVPDDFLLRKRKRQESRLIPRVIYNLSPPMHKRPEYAQKIIQNNREMIQMMQAGYLYLVLEDEACRKEVEKSGIENFLEAYDALIPGAYKADLVRYYLLYRYGGIYLDDKSYLKFSLESDIFDEIIGKGGKDLTPSEFFAGEIPHMRFPEIAFLGTRKGSPIMYKALTQAIDKIMKRDYTSSALSITGNGLLGEVLSKDKYTKLKIDNSYDNIWHRDKVIWRRSAIQYANWPKPTTHYSKLWKNREIYKDRNPPKNDFLNTVTAICILAGLGLLFLMLMRYRPS